MRRKGKQVPRGAGDTQGLDESQDAHGVRCCNAIATKEVLSVAEIRSFAFRRGGRCQISVSGLPTFGSALHRARAAP